MTQTQHGGRRSSAAWRLRVAPCRKGRDHRQDSRDYGTGVSAVPENDLIDARNWASVRHGPGFLSKTISTPTDCNFVPHFRRPDRCAVYPSPLPHRTRAAAGVRITPPAAIHRDAGRA